VTPVLGVVSVAVVSVFVSLRERLPRLSGVVCTPRSAGLGFELSPPPDALAMTTMRRIRRTPAAPPATRRRRR
jgi:hypothetical protein